MAFGTDTTCYVPVERRRGGKEPSQRRSFRGILVGYVDNMPAYRIWDLKRMTFRSVSYNFTICHESSYPFRDKAYWPPGTKDDPLSSRQSKKFLGSTRPCGGQIGPPAYSCSPPTTSRRSPSRGSALREKKRPAYAGGSLSSPPRFLEKRHGTRFTLPCAINALASNKRNACSTRSAKRL